MMKIIKGYEEVYKKAALYFKKSFDKILLEKKFVILGLPGGRSITNILDYLKKEDIDWEKIHIFMVDERLVPIDHIDSNFKLIKQALSGIIPDENLHPFIFDLNNELICLKKYESEIMRYGGFFDIAVLSSGEDGHIGCLYPNHSSFFDNSEFYILVNDSPKPPSRRMGISQHFLLKSKIGFLFFIGDSKIQAFLNFSNKDLDISKCPAKLVTKLSESYVFTNINLDSLKK